MSSQKYPRPVLDHRIIVRSGLKLPQGFVPMEDVLVLLEGGWVNFSINKKREQDRGTVYYLVHGGYVERQKNNPHIIRATKRLHELMNDLGKNNDADSMMSEYTYFKSTPTSTTPPLPSIVAKYVGSTKAAAMKWMKTW